MRARLKQWRQQALAALGLPGLLGLAALAAALALQLGLSQPLQAREAELAEQAARLQRQLRQQRLAGTLPEDRGTPQRWLAALPAAVQREQRLAALLRLSAEQGLSGSRTEHRLSREGGLERLRVSMPLQGSYAQLRRLIEAALRQDPALSLDSLKLRRAGADQPLLEAELQWSLFSQSAGGPR